MALKVCLKPARLLRLVFSSLLLILLCMDRCTHSTKYTNLQPENKRNSFAEICIFCGIPKYILTEYMIDTSSGTLSIENYILGTFT